MCFDSGRRELLSLPCHLENTQGVVAFKYFEDVDYVVLRTVFAFLVKLLAI